VNTNQSKVEGIKIPRWIFWVLGIPLCILLVLTALGWYFQQNIQQYLAKQAVQYLDADVEWKGLNISLIKDWPNVRIQLSDVLLKPKKNKNHFLKAKNIQAVLGFWDFWSGNYIIKKIRIDHPNILLEQKQGIWNVSQIKIKETSSKSSKSSFRLALKEVSIHSGQLQILGDDFSSDIQAIDALLSGDFTSKNSSIQTQLTSNIHYFQKEQRRYVENKNFSCQGPLYIRHNGSLECTALKLYLSSLMLQATGSWNWKTQESTIRFHAADGSLTQLISLFPDQWTTHLAHLKAKGAFDLKGNLSYGVSGVPNGLKISGELEKAEMKEPGTKAKLDQLSMHLDLHWWFDNLEKSYLLLENIRTEIGKERIRGQMRWKNFQSGEWDWVVQGKMDVKELSLLFPSMLSQTDSAEGQIWLNLQSSGKWKDWETKNYKEIYQLGQMRLSNAKIVQKDWKFPLFLDAELEFDGQKISIQQLNGKLGASDFNIKGKLFDYWDFLTDSTKKMRIEGSLISENLDTHDFLSSQSASSESSSSISLPQNIALTLDVNIQSFVVSELQAKNLKTNMSWSDQNLIIQNMICSSMGGQIQMDGILKPTTKNPIFSCQYDIQDVDLQLFNQAFPELTKNSSFRDKLFGKWTLKGEMNGIFDSEWHWVTDSMFAKGNFMFKEGKLKQFQPTKRIAKILKLKEFEDLDFSDLSTQFLIDQQRLHLSKFYLRANTLEMTLVGSQGWDQSLDYQVQVFFPRKLSKLRDDEKDEWIDTVEPDGRASVFLKINGTIDQPNIQVDMKSTRKKLMENLFKNKNRNDSLKKTKKVKVKRSK